MKRNTTFILFCILTLLWLSACATVKKETGQLNLKYAFPNENIPKTNLAIAIVSPEFTKNENDQTQNYRENIKGAFNNTFQELITRKGFNIKGPYSTFDDMAYGEKEGAYLAMIPVLKFNLEKTGAEACENTLCTDKGYIRVVGELRLDFIEPLTKEKILVKRINLSDLGIQKPYTVQRIKRHQGENAGLANIIGDITTGKKELVDDIEKAFYDAINEFYAKSMDKIWVMTSTKEVLSYQAQIKKLKGLKRF